MRCDRVKTIARINNLIKLINSCLSLNCDSALFLSSACRFDTYAGVFLGILSGIEDKIWNDGEKTSRGTEKSRISIGLLQPTETCMKYTNKSLTDIYFITLIIKKITRTFLVFQMQTQTFHAPLVEKALFLRVVLRTRTQKVFENAMWNKAISDVSFLYNNIYKTICVFVRAFVAQKVFSFSCSTVITFIV